MACLYQGEYEHDGHFRTKLTQLLHLGLVTLTLADLLLGGLAELDGLFDREIPSIALNVAGGLECVVVAVQLEGNLMWRLLLEIRGIVQRQDVGRTCAVSLTLLVEEKKAFAGLAGPGDDCVGNLGLLATKVQIELLRGDGLIVQPKLLLGGNQRPAVCEPFA